MEVNAAQTQVILGLKETIAQFTDILQTKQKRQP